MRDSHIKVLEIIGEYEAAADHRDFLEKQKKQFKVEPPTFPERVYNDLPPLIARTVEKFSNNRPKMDYMLLSSLIATGAVMKPVYGVFGRKRVHPNLFMLLSGHAGTGKGDLDYSFDLVRNIHDELVRQSKEDYSIYQTEMAQWRADKDKAGPMPELPDHKLVKMPGDQTKAAMVSLLAQNDGMGFIFETEADALSTSLKNDNGQHSELFRKAFHHEVIDAIRKTDREYHYVDNPRLSVVMSGTPDQAKRLIPSTENGLFSRFIFYNLPDHTHYADPHAGETNSLDGYFNELGRSFSRFHKRLCQHDSVQFSLSADQKKRSTAYFEAAFEAYKDLHGHEFSGSIIRMALVLYRLAMILTILRLDDGMDHAIPPCVTCSDQDFSRSLWMCQALIHHSSEVLGRINKAKKQNGKIQELYSELKRLGPSLSTGQVIDIAKNIDIPERSAKRYLDTFCRESEVWKIVKEAHGKYKIMT